MSSMKLMTEMLSQDDIEYLFSQPLPHLSQPTTATDTKNVKISFALASLNILVLCTIIT